MWWRVVMLWVGLAGAVQADTAPPLGTYQGTITSIGTTLGTTYNPTQGVVVVPQAQLQVTPSPFGPLVLRGDGRYEMPVMGFAGAWRFDPATGQIALSGALAAGGHQVNGLTITLQIPDGAGGSTAVDYAYQGAAGQPSADTAPANAPNGDHHGRFVYFDGAAMQRVDLATGVVTMAYPTTTGAWVNAQGLALHLDPDAIRLRDAGGAELASLRPAGWQAGNFWLGEVSPDGRRVLLNGGSTGGAPADPGKHAAISVVDVATGAEQVVLAAGGGFSAAWLDADRVAYQPPTGGLAVFDLRDGTEAMISTDDLRDMVPSPDGTRILLLKGTALGVLDLRSGEVVPVPGEFRFVVTLRWAPDGQSFAVLASESADVTFDLLQLDGTRQPVTLQNGTALKSLYREGGWVE